MRGQLFGPRGGRRSPEGCNGNGILVPEGWQGLRGRARGRFDPQALPWLAVCEAVQQLLQLLGQLRLCLAEVGHLYQSAVCVRSDGGSICLL